ncbi:MAG: hypothetical protein ACRDKJ_03725 [Actinomycetota bacterium]
MAKTVVFRSFEVREGFGGEAGPLRFESATRAEADEALERLSSAGASAELFGIRSRDDGGEGERVLLRILLGQKAASPFRSAA